MISRKYPLGWAFALGGLLATGPALADVKSGVDAWSRGDYPAAIAEWQGPAAQGDADAQFNLGQAYKLGRGVKADLAKAEEYFGKAAASGHLQASDNYGLLLFQRGERAKALPYVTAAADRGEPRAQYLLGLANFNGDNVPKDWVRAYALVSLAQQAGLQQAVSALAQMDMYIPIEQRQKSVALAQQLAAQAEATRSRQLAAVDLGNSVAATATPPVVTAMPRPPASVAVANPPPRPGNPASAGADFTRPRPAPPAPPPPPVIIQPKPPVAIATPRPAPPAPVPPRPVPAPAAPAGSWRIQLGAFSVAANAEAMWDKVKSRPEVAGHAKVLVPAGKVTKLQAGGYSSQAAAQSACTKLAASGIACLAVQN